MIVVSRILLVETCTDKDIMELQYFVTRESSTSFVEQDRFERAALPARSTYNLTRRRSVMRVADTHNLNIATHYTDTEPHGEPIDSHLSSTA